MNIGLGMILMNLLNPTVRSMSLWMDIRFHIGVRFRNLLVSLCGSISTRTAAHDGRRHDHCQRRGLPGLQKQAVERHTFLLFGFVGSFCITIKPKKYILCPQGILSSLGKHASWGIPATKAAEVPWHVVRGITVDYHTLEGI